MNGLNPSLDYLTAVGCHCGNGSGTARHFYRANTPVIGPPQGPWIEAAPPETSRDPCFDDPGVVVILTSEDWEKKLLKLWSRRQPDIPRCGDCSGEIYRAPKCRAKGDAAIRNRDAGNAAVGETLRWQWRDGRKSARRTAKVYQTQARHCQPSHHFRALVMVTSV